MKRLIAVAMVAACAVAQAETTGDYVQGGLVACWDGYENSGPSDGHRSDATKWIDCVQGAEVDLPAWVTVENCSLYSAADPSHVGVPLASIEGLSSADAAWTIEVVQQSDGWVKTDSYGNLQNVFSTPRGSLGYRQNNAKGFYFLGANTATQLSLQNWVHASANIADQHTMSAVLGTSKAACKIWMDGAAGTVNYNGGYNTGYGTDFKFFENLRMGVRVYAIRVYNRALTQDEIAANRAVDVKRFVDGDFTGELTCSWEASRYVCADGVNETVTAKVSGDKTGLRYFWKIDDGDFTEGDRQQRIVFDAAGEHTVTLKVTNTAGEEATCPRTFTVVARNDYKYAVEFTAPAVTVGTDASEFENIPVLVQLKNDDTKFAYSKMSFPETGKDIEFYDLSGNKLPHEIADWNPNGISKVWVKLPKLETGAKFRMVFGCADEEKIVPSTASDIWTGYQAVWHMDGMDSGATAEDPTTTPDATANGMDALVRDTGVSTVAADGAVGRALVCDINNTAKKSGFVVPNSKDLFGAAGAPENFTLSCWIRRTGSGASDWGSETPFATKTGSSAGGFYLSRVNSQAEIRFYTGASATYKTSSCNLSGTDWKHFVLVYNASTHVAYFYRNGAAAGSASVPAADYIVPPTYDLGIGTYPGDENVRGWRGDFDEVRWTRSVVSAQRIAVDYATQANADYFDIQGISHGDSRTVTVTKYIPELGLDLGLPECHQKHLTDTNYVLTCSADPGDLYFTTNDVAYKCSGWVFTPVSGDPIIGDTTSFTFQPVTMGEGALQWQFAAAGYRTRVHALPPFLADKAEITVTPDSAANRLFGCYYKPGTVLTVTLAELEEGVFDGWRGAAAAALEDKTAKTVTYTVGATGSNPDLVASVCGIVDTDDDVRIPSDNCARTPVTTWVMLQEGDNLITAVSTARAGYKANGGAWALCLGPGRYTESTVVQLDFPLIFEGGFGNPTIVNSNIGMERMCWHNLKDARSAFRRLTLESLTREKWTSNPKLSGLVSVAAGMLEGVTVTNAFSGTNYDSGKGAVWVSGTGVVTNCLITHCRGMCASTGKDTLGAVNLAGGLIASTRITHCSSEGTSNGVGGGIYMTAGTVRNCLIDNCTAFKEGSGLYITPSAACVVENCTIADCGACVEQGSSAGTYGVYMTGSSAAKSCTFVNNIVYGNSGASSTQKDTMNLNRVNTTYTYLRNNVFDVQVPDSSTASGNIAGNPAFTDRANGDYTTGKGAGTDRGEDLAWTHDAYAKDLAGNPRILGEGLDVGCYEYVPSDKLDVTVNVILPEEVKVGAVATFAAEASGGAGDYVYAWFVDDVQIVSGAEYATYDYTIAAAGAHSVKCVVTDGDGTSVEKEEKDILRVYIRHGYVSKTGSNTSPYDTPETAADNFDAVFAILDPGAADEVTVGPGEYEVTNVIMLAQKTYLHSTDGAAKTVLRPSAGTSCFACNGTGSVIDGFTVEGLSGAVNAISVMRSATVSNVVIRSCNVSAITVWTQNSLTTENLTLHAVTNTANIFQATGDGGDTHRNLVVTDCASNGRILYAVTHGFVVRNGLFLRVKTGSELVWTQCGGEAVSWRNVTIDDCVVGGAYAFNSNISGNPNYLRNCVVGRVWTTTAKTALRAPLHNGEHCFNCCFLAPAKASANEWKNSFDETDPRLKSLGRLKGSSPCRGQGDPSIWKATDTDIIGNPRLHVDKAGAYTVDMGCYENDPPGLMLMVK